MTNNFERPVVYIYIDNEGIESLYTQTVNRLEIEQITSSEKGKEGKVRINFGMGHVLKLIFGMVDINSSIEGTYAGKRKEEVKSHLGIEHKLRDFIENLRKLSGKDYFEDLKKAAKKCSETKEGVFINIYDTFNMPQFTSYNGGVAKVNKDKSVIFEKGHLPYHEKIVEYDRYNHSDKYYRNKELCIVMNASLSKFPRSRGFMGYTGHDARYFSGFEGKDVPLYVFGYLLPIKDIFFQIKPYAIWQ